MRHNSKRFTVLGVVVIALFALVGLAAMGIAMHKQDIKKDWTAKNYVTFAGSTACLPHKNSDQPHTEECASGLKVGNVYYALNYTHNKSQALQGEVVVSGIYAAPDANSTYQTAGTISVTTITKR